MKKLLIPRNLPKREDKKDFLKKDLHKKYSFENIKKIIKKL